MKKGMMLFASLLFTIYSFAQKDSSASTKQDTIKVGNMFIVKDGRTENTDKENLFIGIKVNSKSKKKNGVRVYSSLPEINDNSINLNRDTLIAINDDTIKIGKFNVIKSQDPNNKKDWQELIEDGDFRNTKIRVEKSINLFRPKKQTNWWIFDLGFANYFDVTSYSDPSFTHPLKGAPLNAKSFSLNNTKSSNVNIWIVQKKTPIAKENWYFKYGIGWQMYNFRFDQPISFRNEGPSYVYLDSKTFSKDKLYVNYLSVPLMINYTAKERKGLNISAGLNVGYLVGSRNKQIAENKMKYAGKFNLNDFQVAGTGEIGIGDVKLYATASLTNLYNKDLTKQFNYPYAIGVRFSRF